MLAWFAPFAPWTQSLSSHPLGSFAVCAALLALPSACAEPEESCDDPLELCDIAGADCQRHVYVQTACVRGHAGRDTPSVSTITRTELEDLIRSDDVPSEAEQRADAQRATALRMLSLLPAGQTSSDEAAIQAYARNVLAFYSRGNASVTIVETNLGDVGMDTSVFILSHEFVHAQQDIDVDLQEFFDANVDTADSLTATRSITEGEAVMYSNLTMSRQDGRFLTAEIFDEYYSSQQAALRESAAGSGAQYTDISSSFPYPFGGQLVTDTWLVEGNPGVLALYDAPPASTAAVLRTLAGAEPGSAIERPQLTTGTVPDDWSEIAEDTLGAWILFAVTRRAGFTESSASTLAEDWAGDRLLVLGGPTEAHAAVAWSVRFGSDASAELFADIEQTAAPEGVRSVQLDGRDVHILMAPDDATLVLAQDAFETAVVEPGGSLSRATAPPAGPLWRRSFEDPRGPGGHLH